MPTYEYECRKCHHAFEAFQSISAKPITACPKCKRRTVQRLMSAGGGLIFKGSGFYITDYRSGDYKAKAESDSKSATPEKKDAAATPEKKEAKTACASDKPAAECKGACASTPKKKSSSKKAAS